MFLTGTISHTVPRVIDGSGRMTLGTFTAECVGQSFSADYSASALDEDRDDVLTAQQAHAQCLDWMSRAMGVID